MVRDAICIIEAARPNCHILMLSLVMPDNTPTAPLPRFCTALCSSVRRRFEKIGICFILQNLLVLDTRCRVEIND